MAAMSSTSRSPVLLIHGQGSSASTWRDVLPKLSSSCSNCQFYAINLRGHGGLPIGDEDTFDLDHLSDDIWHFCDEHDIKRATLIAHSMGCRLAVVAAAKHPERVNGILLLDMEMDPRDPPHLSATELEHLKNFKTEFPDFESLKTHMLEYGYSAKKIDDFVLSGRLIQEDGKWKALLHPYAEHLTISKISTNPDARNAFERLPKDIPISLFIAERESAVSSVGLKWMKDHLPGMGVESVRDADHRIMKTAQDTFVAMTSHFLGTLT